VLWYTTKQPLMCVFLVFAAWLCLQGQGPHGVNTPRHRQGARHQAVWSDLSCCRGFPLHGVVALGHGSPLHTSIVLRLNILLYLFSVMQLPACPACLCVQQQECVACLHRGGRGQLATSFVSLGVSVLGLCF
jgi:hypothetical protein